MAVFFNGQLLVTPVTASAVNDDAMQSQNLTVGNALAIVVSAYRLWAAPVPSHASTGAA